MFHIMPYALSFLSLAIHHQNEQAGDREFSEHLFPYYVLCCSLPNGATQTRTCEIAAPKQGYGRGIYSCPLTSLFCPQSLPSCFCSAFSASSLLAQNLPTLLSGLHTGASCSLGVFLALYGAFMIHTPGQMCKCYGSTGLNCKSPRSKTNYNTALAFPSPH